MRKFNITVNGKTCAVDVEEVGGVQTSAPIAPAPAPAPAPAQKIAPPDLKEVRRGGIIRS